MSGPWAERGLTLLVALAGLGAALLAGLPLPALFGPMLACLVAALLGAPLRAWEPATTASRTVLGVAVGAAITPAIVAQLPAMALSLAVVPAYVALIGLVGVPFFRRTCGMDRDDRLLRRDARRRDRHGPVRRRRRAATPRALSLVHATRVAVIVALAPDRPVGGLPHRARPPARRRGRRRSRSRELALMVVAAVAGLLGGRRDRALRGADPRAARRGAGAVARRARSTTGRRPRSLQLAQFVLGTAISVHYRGITAREVSRTVLAAVAYCAILAALAALVAEAVVLLGPRAVRGRLPRLRAGRAGRDGDPRHRRRARTSATSSPTTCCGSCVVLTLAPLVARRLAAAGFDAGAPRPHMVARRPQGAPAWRASTPAADPRAFRSALGGLRHRRHGGHGAGAGRGARGHHRQLLRLGVARPAADPVVARPAPRGASTTFAGAEAFAVHVLAHDQQAVCDAFVRARPGVRGGPASSRARAGCR